MAQKQELVYYIQGYYSGYGWEDLSGYPCGERKKNSSKAFKEMKEDLKRYRENAPETAYRWIKRYENM